MSGNATPTPGGEEDYPLDGGAPTLDARTGQSEGPRLAAPETVGRFRILHTLGSGGMGVVYLAEDPSLGRKVAIKLLRADRAGHERAQARMQREARALASLSHPNVVVVHEVGLHENQVYLVMEHVAGQTLLEWTRAHAGDWAAILAQYRAAGEGLAAAHRAGIIHRDFKPENVLVDDEGRPRVLDFGLAVPGAELPSSEEPAGEELGDVKLTKTGALLGTPAYMAPEQFMGATVDARSDQFSFCVSLWEALFGRRPFGGEDLMELRCRVIAGDRRRAPARTRVPSSIIDALCQGLAVDPNDRFASMPELLQALEPGRSRRPWVGLAAVGVGLAGALAVAAWLGRERAPAEPPSPSESAASVEVEPQAAEPELPVLTIQPLTHTSGFGVRAAFFGPDRRVMTYSVSSSGSSVTEWWQLSPSATNPRPTRVSVPESRAVHPVPDGSYWLVDDDAVHRLRTDGTVERVVDLGEDEVGLSPPAGWPIRSWLSPRGDAIALSRGSGFEVWDLTGTNAEPARVELGRSPWGLAWSPDGRQIATTVMPSLRGGSRVEVFDMFGTLQASLPWPEETRGQLLQGLAWLSPGLVVLVSDGTNAWLQCVMMTPTGLVTGRRSAGMHNSIHTTLMGATHERSLLVGVVEEQARIIVLDLLDDRAQRNVRTYEVRRNKSNPVWLSDTELAFLAAQPPGALVRVDLDDPDHIDVLDAGPFDWAGGDGEGGVVLGSSGGTVIQYLPAGAERPRPLRFPAVGSSNPYLSCQTPHDCMMTLAEGSGDVFLEVDLERETVRRSFGCPPGGRCIGRWGWSRDGRALFVVDEPERELWRLDAQTGERLGEAVKAPPWTSIQSATETPRGELLLTGIRRGGPPESIAADEYRLMRLEDDGSFHTLWSDDRTWLVRPRTSPSGQRIVLEGVAYHADLATLEPGSLCDAAPAEAQ